MSIGNLETRSALTLVGDSITVGSYIPDQTPPVDAYAKLVNRELALPPEDREIDRGLSRYRTVNISQSGAKAIDFDPNEGAPFGEDLFSRIPASNAVFLYLGTNDAAHLVSVEDYTQSIFDIARTLLLRGVGRVLIGQVATPPRFEQLFAGRAALMLGYREAARYIESLLPNAQAVSVPLTDEDFDPNVNDWLTIHPLASGHRVIADAVLGAL